MNITLLNYTAEAEKLLIFTKHTRRMDGIKAWEELDQLSEQEKAEELSYILQTISGPWEFIDYTFFIQGVTRAFTHQLVRHRVGTSFAQESLRIADKRGFGYRDDTQGASMLYNSIMGNIENGYEALLKAGVPVQEARGVLPTNILTNITMKINLRALNSMMNTRLCVRASGEFQEVAKIIRNRIIGVHPWAERVLLPFCLEWETCKFQAYNDCPLKKVHPWLNKKNNEISCEAKRDWEKILGFSPQPK